MSKFIFSLFKVEFKSERIVESLLLVNSINRAIKKNEVWDFLRTRGLTVFICLGFFQYFVSSLISVPESMTHNRIYATSCTYLCHYSLHKSKISNHKLITGTNSFIA